jgi:hypothetical protein
MNLSEHFTLEELLHSDTAARLNIPNTPTDEDMLNIRSFLVPGLEKVRAFLGQPMMISSGYRSKELNAHTPGSSDTSAHTHGYAADCISPAFGDPWVVCNAVAGSGIPFDQIIYEYGRWMHISFDPRLRGLTTTKLAGQPYRAGFHKE